MLSHRQRIENCLAENHVDRLPVALWRHFPVDDQTPEGLARSTIQFQQTYDFDLVKITPSSSFCLKDWGVQDIWLGDSEGTRTYTQHIIQSSDDWGKLPPLHPLQGNLSNQLKAINLILKETPASTPVLQTIFNPLSQAKNLVGSDTLLVHIRKFPEEVHAGLKIITESTLRFIEYLPKASLAGIFYAVQHAQCSLLSPQEYAEFGEPYDRLILNHCQEFWLNMLHLHGVDVYFNKFIDYPVKMINWHDQDTPPTLRDAASIFPGILCGGLQRQRILVQGTPDEVKIAARRAILEMNGKRLLLSTGCVVPITAPAGNLLAARRSVELVS